VGALVVLSLGPLPTGWSGRSGGTDGYVPSGVAERRKPAAVEDGKRADPTVGPVVRLR
jgi:hypothetical protein